MRNKFGSPHKGREQRQEAELAVHDQPCHLCQHYSPEGERAGICKKNLMRVTAAMHVTYWRTPDATLGRHGLCFVQNNP